MAYPPKHPSERFWDKVGNLGSDVCWPWRGAVDAYGYGFLYAGPCYHTGARWVKAHRLSWEMHNDRELEPGEYVLHHCDNPPCVNPAHLYVGTKKDNAQDRTDRKRGKENRQRGENNDNAKLSEKQVRDIITELKKLPRRSQTDIAAQFGIGQAHVSRIMLRQTWAHLWDE